MKRRVCFKSDLSLFVFKIKQTHFIMTTQTSSLRPKISRMARIIKIRGLLIGALVLVAAYYYETTALTLKPDLDVTYLPQLFGYLILISLFVERAIEFVLSLWRSAEADVLDRNIGTLKEKIAKLADDSAEAKVVKTKLIAELELAEDERVNFKADSRLAALWIGVTIGVFVSLVGVRIMGSVFEAPASTQEFHARMFILVDVLLTGFVLAGGSGAIHKIMSLYDSAMNRATENNKMKTGQN
jgi:hypothetical protein